MSATWGNNFTVTIFGESHGKSVGVVLGGLIPGLELDEDFIIEEMKRRAPGSNQWSSTRKEADYPRIQSGVYEGKVTGAPLAMIINNGDHKSTSYMDLIGKARPGHSDYTAHVRYSGMNDQRGGGHFSGRLTAGLVFAGAIAKQYLNLLGIVCGAWITSIHDVKDSVIFPDKISSDWLSSLRKSHFPVRDESLAQLMKNKIEDARLSLDSVGGTVAVCALGIPAGWGDPFFESIESRLSSIYFSVPAIKGVEFGLGFGITTLRGSEANDSWYIDDSQYKTRTNNNGGINGGISNGMPLCAHIAVKPTPSIARSQDTIDFINQKETTIAINGRHDPCIVPRAVAVLDAVTAITLFDFAIGIMGKGGIDEWMVKKGKR